MAKRTDSNQAEIVKALRAVGASVLDLHLVGKGCPDVLVAYRHCLYLLEIKTAAGKLKPRQIEWHRAWGDPKPITVSNVPQALAAIGAI